MAAMQPLPPGQEATLQDILDRVEQSHGCLEDMRGELREVRDQVKTVKGAVGSLKSTVATMKTEVVEIRGAQRLLVQGFGLPPDAGKHSHTARKPRRFLASLTRKEGIWAIIGASSGAAFMARVVYDAAPGVWHAVWHAILTVH
jgi:hypothetical protein